MEFHWTPTTIVRIHLVALCDKKTNRIFDESSRLSLAEHSFSINAAKLWNKAPAEVKSAKSRSLAWKEILAYVKTHQLSSHWK